MEGAEGDDSKAQSIHNNINTIFGLVYFKINFWGKRNDIIKKNSKRRSR